MNHLSRLAERMRALQGWRAYGVAFLLGVCFTAAFPPFWLLPLAMVAFSGWVWMGQGAETRKQAFTLGWWFGFGHHTTGLYWICIALGIDGGAFWWLMPFALCLLPAYLALFTGAAGAVCHKLRYGPLSQVVLFALAWLVAEFLRANLFYGFPWNLAGYIWTISDATLQSASVVGVYGLSLWAVLFCAAFSLLSPMDAQYRRAAFRGFAVLMAASALLAGWGELRLQLADTSPQESTGVNLRLVQANVEQSLKWDPEFQWQALQRHISMSRQPAPKGLAPDIIIWPETAMPFQLEEGSRWVEVLAGSASKDGVLITGVVRSVGQGKDWQVWNSLRGVDAHGLLTQEYDKAVLVPFGEFVPLRSLLSFLPIEKVTQGTTDFSKGAGARLLEMGESGKFQPLICYETIFSGFRPEGTRETGWLLNITNDAWFGTSTGPYQHLHMARTRAVERGAPMVRVANTGISAIFDSYGRIMGYLPLNQQGILDMELPPRLSAPSWYSRFGEVTVIIICSILVITAFRAGRKTT